MKKSDKYGNNNIKYYWWTKEIFNWILILKYIKKLENSENLKAYGKQLSGNLAGEYSFRVSDYRILAIIEDNELKIYAIKIGHRSKVYDIQEIQYNLKK